MKTLVQQDFNIPKKGVACCHKATPFVLGRTLFYDYVCHEI